MAKLTIVPTTSESTPSLPVLVSQKIAEATSEHFGTCDIYAGIDEKTLEILIIKSQDTHDEALMRTSDRERFANRASYEKWYKKGRVPFALVHRETGDLMALVWLGQKNPAFATEPVWHTISYRAYPPYRGGGFMTVFTSYVMNGYMTAYPNHKLWARIHKDNGASQALAERLGFVREPHNETEDDWVILTR